jgi:cephalosporin-C deacetylase
LLALLVLWTPALDAQDKKKKPEAPPPPLQARCDRDDAMYKVGEKATFFIWSENDGDASWQLSNDGYVIIDSGKITMEKGKRYTLESKMLGPGFVQLRVTLGGDKAIAAAAFDPHKITPTAKAPRDFDDFWAAGLKELAAVPINAKLTRSEEHTKKGKGKYTCYKITLDNVEKKKVHGWITVPAGKGPFPAILTVPGAGVVPIPPDVKHAEMGALSMNIIIHDLPVDESKDFFKKQADGPLKDYRDIGATDKNKSYYRAVILGCVRCLDYLTSRPDYNGKDLGVTGGSQGGALTLITSGLDPRVTLAAPNVAAMCDHSGYANKRVGGWPHWLNRFKEKDQLDKALEASAYYDAVNFARKFKGKSLHGVGFVDTVCAPTTVYAAYNVHPEPKTMINSPAMGHGTDPRWVAARDRFWKANMALMPPK